MYHFFRIFLLKPLVSLHRLTLPAVAPVDDSLEEDFNVTDWKIEANEPHTFGNLTVPLSRLE